METKKLEIKIRIKRSDEYVQQRMVETSAEVPLVVETMIPLEECTEDTRRLIVGWSRLTCQKFFETLWGLGIDADTGRIGYYGRTDDSTQLLHRDIEADELTPQMVDDYVQSILDKSEAIKKQVEADREKAEAEREKAEAKREQQEKEDKIRAEVEAQLTAEFEQKQADLEQRTADISQRENLLAEKIKKLRKILKNV